MVDVLEYCLVIALETVIHSEAFKPQSQCLQTILGEPLSVGETGIAPSSSRDFRLTVEMCCLHTCSCQLTALEDMYSSFEWYERFLFVFGVGKGRDLQYIP